MASSSAAVQATRATQQGCWHQGACNWLMKRLNRRSVIIIAMVILMGSSVIIISYEVRSLGHASIGW